MGAYHVRGFARKVQGSAPLRHFIEVSFEKEDQQTREFALYRNRDEKCLATMVAETLPGCCGVLLMHKLKALGPQGIVGLVNLIEAGAIGAQKARYGQAMLTLLSDSVLIPDLHHRGWATVSTFLNGKTDHQVTVLVKPLVQAPRPAPRDETGGE